MYGPIVGGLYGACQEIYAHRSSGREGAAVWLVSFKRLATFNLTNS